MATATKNRVNGNGQSQAQTNGSSKRPIWTKKAWPLQVAVFEFENDKGLTHSIRLTRSFRRDDESEWETTEYLSGSDLLRATRLLLAADAFIQSRLEAYYKAHKASQTDGHSDVPVDDTIPF